MTLKIGIKNNVCFGESLLEKNCKFEVKIMDKKLTSHKSKEDFAKAMNCSIELINQIDDLTDSKSLNNLNNKSKFKGNVDRGYCGRSFENDTIWIGCFFERPYGFKLMVGFWIPSDVAKIKNSYFPNLLKSHRFLFAKYAKKDEDGYWFYVKIDDFLLNYDCINKDGSETVDGNLKNCNSIDKLREQIEEICDEVRC